MSKPQYPPTVSILDETDVIKHCATDAAGRHCISGWIDADFAQDPVARAKALTAVKRAIRVLDADHFKSNAYDSSIVTYNDHADTPKRTIARAYNYAMALLGYVVGNPEARTLARRRKVAAAKKAKGGPR